MQVGRFGTYENVVVRDVPVGPKTDADAATWATAILVARAEAAGTYVAPTGWEHEWRAATDGTPLAGRVGTVPDPRTVESVNGSSVATRTRWLLSAGSDLGLGA